ncbi:MAG TPA: CHY zinc finger protein [Pyrinomonadaceae bacterium]|nr:CHY zinc finger protein [Pyrinomonadaceae bacterium]
MRTIHGEMVYGVNVEPQTRCAHWHSDIDIIAIKFRCCAAWYPCDDCHTALAGHEAQTWPREHFDEPAVLCGACGHQLTVTEYLLSESVCPSCSASFNPGCAKHYHLYFEKLI